MGSIMKRITLLAGIALTISGVFASQTFAASGCLKTACDPAAAAACDPAAATAEPAPEPAPNTTLPPPTEDVSDSQPATCAAPASCNPAAAAAAACNGGCKSDCNGGCKSGCHSNAPKCGACSDCGSFGCNGACKRNGCADAFFGKLKKSIREGTCWSGYMNAGYFTNFKGDPSNGYTDCWSSTSPAFNALYLSGVKKAYTGGCGYDVGFGIDFMFGEDARIFHSARGLDQGWTTGHMADGRDSYGFAMPQLYVEMAINNWAVKMGHFYGVLGYEGATANSRFFYTKGLLCSVSPVAQTGVLATYSGFENLDVTLGWVNGWNNGFDNSDYGEGMIEGAFTYRMNQYASIKYAFLAGTTDLAGPFGFIGPNNSMSGDGSASVHNVVLDLQLTGRLESVSLLYYGDFEGNTILVLGEHLYYDINCCTKAGFRAEWMKYSENGSESELTTYGIGLNIHPEGYQNLYIRPELRYDKVNGDTAMLNGRVDQFTIGFDVMLTF